MGRIFRRFWEAHPQTKFFIFNAAIYMTALLWTFTQAYLRLAYDQNALSKPWIIEYPAKPDSSTAPATSPKT